MTVRAYNNRNYTTLQSHIARVRAQHAPSGRGHASAALKLIDSLLGTPQDPTGLIPYAQARLAQHSSALALATTSASRALHAYRIQRTHWDISDLTTSLATARAEVATLCPNSICVPPASLILWELRALALSLDERTHTHIPTLCAWRLRAHPDPDALAQCIAHESRESVYLRLAHPTPIAKPKPTARKRGAHSSPLPPLLRAWRRTSRACAATSMQQKRGYTRCTTIMRS